MLFRNIEDRVESARVENFGSRLRKRSHPDATPTIEPPGDITFDAPRVPTVQYALVELISLYNRLAFDSFTELDGTFAVLRIELPFLFDKAKRYIDLLNGQFGQRSRTMTIMKFEEINKLLERYVSTVYSSVLAFRKLIGLNPVLAIASKENETLSVLRSCVASISHLNSEAATAVSSGATSYLRPQAWRTKGIFKPRR